MYEAKVLADSICGENRITTIVCTFPEIVHKQFLKHRMLSINTRSHRALPTSKVKESSNFVPNIWTKNGKGMVASETVEGWQGSWCSDIWTAAKNDIIKRVEQLEHMEIHKEKANRLLEPFSWCTMIITGTFWLGDTTPIKKLKGFFDLRLPHDAQDEIRQTAGIVKEVFDASNPVILTPGSWHFSFITDEEKDLTLLQKIKLNCARAARVSYLSHDGKRDLDRDYDLYDRLVNDEHMSALEHCAQAVGDNKYYANLKGWKSWRYKLEWEGTEV